MGFMQMEVIEAEMVRVDRNGETIYYGPRDEAEDIQQGDEVEIVGKYGARLSAPGYLDCTDWCAGETEDEAVKAVDDLFDLCPKCHDNHDGEECGDED